MRPIIEEPNRIRRLAGGLALLGISAVLALLGIGLLRAPARYQAVAQIKINRESPPAGLADAKNKSNAEDPYYLPTEVNTIRSPLILDRVVEDLKLNQEWGRKYNGGVPLRTSEAVDMLQHSVDVSRVRDTSLVEIKVSNEEAKAAADLANRIAETYRAHRLAQSFELMSNGMAAVMKEWDQQEALVHAAQTNVDRLRGEVGITDAEAASRMPTPTLSTETERQIHSQLITLKAVEANQETTLQKITNLPPAKLREVIQIVLDQPDPELSSMIAQLDLAEASLLKVSLEFTPDHPRFVNAKKLVEQWNEKINARIEGILVGLQTRLDRTSAAIAELSHQLQYATTNDLARVERYRPYYAAKQKLQEMVDFEKILGMKVDSLKAELTQSKPAPVELLESAVPPLQPVSSHQPLGAGLIVSGGLLGLAGIVVLRRKPEASGASLPA